MSASKISTIKLLSLVLTLLLSSTTVAYTTQSPHNRPFVRPLELEEIVRGPWGMVPSKKDEENPGTLTKRASYNLGIGKNKPVYGSAAGGSPAHLLSNDMSESTQFLVEHQSTREFPSPLSVLESQSKASETKKVVPKVNPERRSTDALHIVDIAPPPSSPAAESLQYHETTTTKPPKPATPQTTVPPVIWTTSKAQLDVNTVWVEMMLHSEQAKAAAAYC